MPSSPLQTTSPKNGEKYADGVNWDDLGFGLIPIDYMYTMKCSDGENFSQGSLSLFAKIELCPSAGILNYGQGLFEGLKAMRTEDGRVLLFRLEENALRMKMGAERMCMPSPSVEQFVDAVKQTVLANKLWVSAFIKVCQEQINVLKNSINDEEAQSKGWLGIRDHSTADTIAHKHGVVLILSERLHSVTSRYDQLRSIRFQDTFSRATPRRKVNHTPKPKPEDTSDSNNLEVREPEAFQTQSLTVQQRLLDDETRALQVELTSLLDAVQETETKMVEMSALNQLMSTHVLQQREQIEQLYEQAVEATHNVDLGNKELSKAIQRNTRSSTFLLLFLFVLTFSVLFLDWCS